ncbi:phosphomevalonate kinase [Streptococcus sp. X13SY08]|uniref:phosphomevalonate kinase n=1 Tax=Streptococcus sp. X13SY08 TaxID=1676616 RepID=UPI000AE2B442|nr:phosphomevalonate kinase [Streptococcus sp. X13SY08]
MRVQEKAPGKLYLAGEYAVVEAGYPALIAAMDQYITVTAEKSESGRLYSSQNPSLVLAWKRESGQLSFSMKHPYASIESAMRTAETYAVEQGCSAQGHYHLSVDSELDHAETGTKYGLGSSGAVTVAVIKSLLAYYGLSKHPLVIYKLAVLAQMKLEMTGSFGDIAASSFGGVIAYSSVNRTWLSQAMARQSIKELVDSEWKNLEIRAVQLPMSIQLMVGWTGASASTDQLVQHFLKIASFYKNFHRPWAWSSRHPC